MSDPKVSVAIMAHPKRKAFIPSLQAALDRPATVVWDAGDNNRWNTGRRAMLAYDRDATHHLVVQDDAIVCRHLVAGVEKALRHVPAKSPVCLYAGKVRPFRDAVQRLVQSTRGDTSWLTMSQIHWGVGIVMPTELIERLVAWCDTRSNIDNYDRRISRWVQHERLTVYYPWPSLVDHRHSPSLVPGRSANGRRAHRFIGANTSALTRDWGGKVVSISSLSRKHVPPRVAGTGELRPFQAPVSADMARRAGKEATMGRFHDPYRLRERLNTYLQRRKATQPAAASRPKKKHLSPHASEVVPSAETVTTAVEAPEPEAVDTAVPVVVEESTTADVDQPELAEAESDVPDGPPPTSGPGSGASAWREYVRTAHGVDGDGMSRPQLIALHEERSQQG